MALTLDPILLSDIKALFEYRRDIYRNLCNMPAESWKSLVKYPGTLKRIGEKGISCNVMLKPGHGFGAGSIPEYTKPTEVQATFDIQSFYVRVELERIAAELSRDETVQKIDNYLTAQEDMARFHYNRMLFGDGTGRIAKVTAVDGTKTYITIAPIFSDPTAYPGAADRYFYQGMEVDTFVGGTQHDNDIVITNVDTTNHRLYSTTGAWASTAANDYIYLAKSKDKSAVEFVGFPGAIDAGGAILDSYGGYAATTYKNWSSTVLNLAGGNITRGVLYEFCCDIYNNSGGKIPIRCLVTTPAVADKYFEQGTDINRIFQKPSPGLTWDIGIPKMVYTSPYWGELPILIDPQGTEGTIYFVSKAFNIAELTPFDWLPGDDRWGGYFTHTKLLGYDYLHALGVADFTVFTGARNSHGKIININIAAAT